MEMAHVTCVDPYAVSVIQSLMSSNQHVSQSCRLGSHAVTSKEIVRIEDLALDFTVPGYDIELRVSRAKSWKRWLELIRCKRSLMVRMCSSRHQTCRSILRKSSMPWWAKVLRGKPKPSEKGFRKCSLSQICKHLQQMNS